MNFRKRNDIPGLKMSVGWQDQYCKTILSVLNTHFKTLVAYSASNQEEIKLLKFANEFKDVINRNPLQFRAKNDFTKVFCDNLIKATTQQLIEFYSYNSNDVFAMLLAICYRYKYDIFEYTIPRCSHFDNYHLSIIQKIYAAKYKMANHHNERFEKVSDKSLLNRDPYIYVNGEKNQLIHNHKIFFSYEISNIKYIVPIIQVTTSTTAINDLSFTTMLFTTEFTTERIKCKLSFMFDAHSILFPIHRSSEIYYRCEKNYRHGEKSVMVSDLKPHEYRQLVATFAVG